MKLYSFNFIEQKSKVMQDETDEDENINWDSIAIEILKNTKSMLFENDSISVNERSAPPPSVFDDWKQ